MLTRRHIRVKVLQSLYAYYNQEHSSVEKQEKFLVTSMEKMHDLYLLMLAVMLSVHSQAKNFMELSKNKHLATEEDKKPSRNFIDNKVLLLLEENKPLENAMRKRKLNHWELNAEYPQILFKDLRSREFYTNYLQIENPSFNQDLEFIIKFFKEVVAPNEKLYDYLEDVQITWTDDFPIVNTAVVKMLNGLKPNTKPEKYIPALYKNDDDEQFARALLKKAIAENETLMQEVEGKTPNWDRERIAELDLILIKMGILEFLHFPSIPVKVTINEYLEIAKEYSTPKSSLFINGLLDKMVKEYTKNSKVNKTGRGLL